jgi:tetratricopeptide (TPR) repeat protein
MARARKSTSKPASIRTISRPTSPFDSETLNTLMLQAVDHQREGRLQDAAEIYKAVEARNPDSLNAPHLHAMVEAELGLLTSSADRLRAVTRRRPDWPEAWTSLAYVYGELGQWRDAVDAYERALSLKPHDPATLFELASALEVVGRLSDAVDIYRELAATPGNRLSALDRISQTRFTPLTPNEIEEMAVAAVTDATPTRLRISLYTALGEMYDRAGRYDDAFEAFAHANRLRREGLIKSEDIPPANREMVAPENKPRQLSPEVAAQAEIADIRRIKALFTREFMTEYGGRGSPIAAPIFIVGIPRCGSTLLEQILSSHRKVQGMGESLALNKVLSGKFPEVLSAPCPPDHFRRLAQDYLAEMHHRGWKNTARFVDKTLPNFFYIGMIHLMFPNAVIINSARDPVDNCLACFRQQFASWETLYDLKDIGETYVRYREVMAHWDEILPGRVINVSHEQLVADPDSEIPRLVTEVCGLPWDDACLRFYDTQRPVRTASVAQVRQPIFKTSVERWRRYEKHLVPLFEALGPYAPPEYRKA